MSNLNDILEDTFSPIESPLREQLVDFASTSGPAVAIGALQMALGVCPDGILDADTLSALAVADIRTINNQVLAERLRMIGRIVARDKKQAADASTRISHALKFLA